MWAVEFYYQDFLVANPVAHARILANIAVANEPNSWNDNFTIFSRVWKAQSSDQQRVHLLNETNFLAFLQSVVGSVGNAQRHWIPLLKHKEWHDRIHTLVSHPWDRRNLVIGNVERAIHSHHP